MSRRSSVGLALLWLAAASGAEPAVGGRRSSRDPPKPLTVHETVEVTGRPVESAWVTVVARDADGIGVPDLGLGDVRVEQRIGGAWRAVEPVAGSLSMKRSSRPVALTLVVDVSASVRRDLGRSVSFSRAILRELHDDDRLRVVTFADEVRATKFILVGDLRVQALLDLLERAASSKRGRPDLPACIERSTEADRIDARILRMDPAKHADLVAWLAHRAASCSDADLALAMEIASDEWVTRTIGRAGGATFDGPAMHEALDAMLTGDGDAFLPLYDANLGLVLMGDCLGYCGAYDPSMAELERLLCLQRWTLSVGGPCRYRGDGERGISLVNGESEAARSVVESLRCVHEVRFDVMGEVGRLRVVPASERAIQWQFLKSPDTLPPRDVFVALVRSAREESAGYGEPIAHAFLDRLALASPSVRDALLRIAPLVDPAP